ncbi:hypothetical protein PHLCEN_2v2652 [Hermanssonia centrifuga]|uniref:Uncharacterized protein n=1 Tax=Hermanssonia centrifuga TaxID=98765 RepID=A0A2R6RIL4_9APHY|nr:hypothetical protein PHLCEN_2v2652 [Hermanssonia centrifuga]
MSPRAYSRTNSRFANGEMIKSQLPSTPNGKLPDPFETFIYCPPEEDATDSKDPHILISSPFQPVLLPDPDSPMPFPGPITRSSFSSPKAMEESPTRICLSRRSSDTSENSCQSYVEARALRSFSTLNAASTLLDLASSPTISSIWTPQNEFSSFSPRKSFSSPFSSPQRQTSTFPWPNAKQLSTDFLDEEEFANSQSSSADYSAFSSSPLVSTPSSAQALFSSSPNVKFGLWDMAKYVTSVSPIQRHGERPKSPESPTHSAQGGRPEKMRFRMKRQTDTSFQDVAQLSPLSSLSSSASSSPSIGHALGGINSRSRSRSSGPRTFSNITRIPSIASRIQKLTGRLCRSESQDLSLSPFHTSVVEPPNGAEQKEFALKDWQQTPLRTRLRSSRAVTNPCASTSLNVTSLSSESPNSYMPKPRFQDVTRSGVKNTKRSKRTLPLQDTGRLPNEPFPALKKPRLDSAPHSAPLTPSTQALRSSIAASPINDLVDVLEAPNNTVTSLSLIFVLF